jgi:UMF1 family MFS transporter
MPLFPDDALNDGVRKREVFGWAMYDFANSGYTTVVLTAVFSAYFVGAVAGGAAWATFAWTSALAVSRVLVMLTMSAIGAWADLHGAKKKVLLLATVGCVATTAALALVGRGDVALAVALIILSNLFFAWGEAVNGAFLPELSRPEATGRVSGWGWSFGYFGGMLALGLGLAWVLTAQARQEPATQYVPVTMLITAGLYLVASSFTFALLRERTPPQAGAGGAGGGLGDSLRRLMATLRDVRRYRDFGWLLACGLAYQAGIAVVIALAAVYAEQALGFKQVETMMLIFLVNIAAAAGAFAFGYWQDRVGHKRALGITLFGWLVMIVLAWQATGPGLFWVAAVIAGLCMGSSQSAGRAIVGMLAPRDRLAEFFGLWAFATSLASIIGPLTYGLVTWITAGNHRLAILSTLVFFVVGWLLLRPVDVSRGRQAALGNAP